MGSEAAAWEAAASAAAVRAAAAQAAAELAAAERAVAARGRAAAVDLAPEKTEAGARAVETKVAEPEGEQGEPKGAL